MKNYKKHALALSVVVLAVVAFFSFVARAGHDLSQQAQSEIRNELKKTLVAVESEASEGKLRPAAVVERVAESGVATEALSLLGKAAERNVMLSRQLSWAFGGKQQRGWTLYVPLISQLIEHEHEDHETADFASALARWQRGAGLHASGVLDNETLARMVSTWQGSRMKHKGYPTPEQLITAPASEFYDPARPGELRQVEREAYAAYKRMLAAAAADKSLGLKLTASGELAPEEKFLKIVSSFRSREHQARLRQQSPHSGRAGLAVNSPHFTGRALDLYVGGEPVTTRDDNRAIQVKTPAYKWLVRNAHKFGFRPYYYEPWHWEYVGN
jgi:uncharacterized protein YcbK (DUF882 family)